MNFKALESATKLRGGYYTKPEIAAFLLRWVLQIQPRRILEPGCGDGVFLKVLSDIRAEHLDSVTAFEIEPAEARKARRSAAALDTGKAEVYSRDFLEWALGRLMGPALFDAVVGNPPFIRYQYLESDLQARAAKIFEYFRLPFTMHTNAWVPFVIASVALLRPGGRLAMVVPAELLHVLHAQSLRTFLSKQCSRILVFDPQELWWGDSLQGAVLLLAEKNGTIHGPSHGVAIVRTQSEAFLNQDPSAFFSRAEYTDFATLAGKWMLAFLTPGERQLWEVVRQHPAVFRFADVAEVDVGIVTGANKFFLVPDAVVQKYSLQKWAFPMFGRSEHVPGVIYDKKTHLANRKAGLPTNFLWLRAKSLSDLSAPVREYVKLGEAERLHTRYKCRVRDPWYCVPSVYAAPVGMLKRSHDFPRLVLNVAKAFTTDTAYRIRPTHVGVRRLVFSFVNSVTALSAELEGRHYGGGVLELVPSEIEKVLLPLPRSVRFQLRDLDNRIRTAPPPEEILSIQDEVVLTPLGLTAADRAGLRNAWMRLRSRRQRIAEPQSGLTDLDEEGCSPPRRGSVEGEGFANESQASDKLAQVAPVEDSCVVPLPGLP